MKSGSALLGVFVALLLMPVLTVLFGAYAGWVVGLFFETTILGFFASLGVTGLSMWQIGAALGFISGFLRHPSASSAKFD